MAMKTATSTTMPVGEITITARVVVGRVPITLQDGLPAVHAAFMEVASYLQEDVELPAEVYFSYQGKQYIVKADYE